MPSYVLAPHSGMIHECLQMRHWAVGSTYRNSSESQNSTAVLVRWWSTPSRRTSNLQGKRESGSQTHISPPEMKA